ncbi:hypothetical protein P167DRAFT_576732 [Morchella conica CCBAS932]|uniref:Uncharacterized protein n=1 Tax=Morchella conica CCBAS932 TaxID=1392247 RepID=A0A3N4KH57_9PEZI|nr:hypothetical protein P167DRAFT_576732 [Morchella conica CCBAS932]
MSCSGGCPGFSEQDFQAFRSELEANTDSVLLLNLAEAGKAAQDRRRGHTGPVDKGFRQVRGHRRQSAIRSNSEFEAYFGSRPCSSAAQTEISVPCNVVIPTIVIHTPAMTETEISEPNVPSAASAEEDGNLGEAFEVQDDVHAAAKKKPFHAACDSILMFLKKVLRLN